MTSQLDLERSQLEQLEQKTLMSIILTLQQTVVAQSAEIQQLHDQLAKNSRNSGKPPSSDRLKPPPTRAYTLTGLTNYTWYTVTLNAMLALSLPNGLDSTPFLTDTVQVMPTDIFVYLPLVLRGYGP